MNLRQRAASDRANGRLTFRRFYYENGLTLILLLIFLVLWSMEFIIGLHAYNEDRRSHHQPPVAASQYVFSGHFIEATTENWESEFLEMSGFAWLTSHFYQLGSSESDDPYDPDADEREHREIVSDTPWPVKRGGWVAAIYARSLTYALLLLFLMSFCIHCISGARAYSEDQIWHGQPPVSAIEFLQTSAFWFQSFQNWQSEFLGILSFVVLSIFLRQKGSPQSKAMCTPTWENE